MNYSRLVKLVKILVSYTKSDYIIFFILFLRSPFQAHTFLFVYMRDTLLSTSAPRRRSISDFSCTCGTRRRPDRGQILGPLGPTTCTLPNELTGPTDYIIITAVCNELCESAEWSETNWVYLLKIVWPSR